MNDDEPPTTITLERGAQSVEVIGEQLADLADAADRLVAEGLTDRAVVVLLHDLIGPSRITKSAIREVLAALPRLREFVK